jgi:hypothetical protein
MFLKLLIINLFFILVSIAGLAIRLILKKHGKFPETHISRNKEMQQRGISCAQDINIGCNPGDESGACPTCGVKRL